MKLHTKIAALSIACSLAFVVNAAPGRDLAGPFTDDVEQASTVIQYPSEQKLLDIYYYMEKNRFIQPGIGLLATNITGKVLESVYDRALELGVVDKNGVIQTADKTDPLRVTSKAISRQCLDSAATCAAAAVTGGSAAYIWAKKGTKAVCAAAAVEAGVDAPVDLACVAAVALFGVAEVAEIAGCGFLIADCKHQDPAVANFTLPTLGVRTGPSDRQNCPNGGRVSKVITKKSSRSDGTFIGSLTAVCADGTELKFFKSHSVVSSRSTDCHVNTGHLMNGYQGISNPHLNGVKWQCEAVGTASDTYNNGLFPGSQGTLGSMLTCPQNQYIYGMKVWGDTTKKVVNGFEAYCT
jgi:hypothetical protein